jgi:hypothetical protein
VTQGRRLVDSQLLLDREGERTWVVVFETGEEALSGLREFARECDLTASHFTAIGAFSDAVLGFFDPGAKRYIEIPLREQVEVLSLNGNIARHDGEPKVKLTWCSVDATVSRMADICSKPTCGRPSRSSSWRVPPF